MLGINYRKIESSSVGYKTDYEMFSLDFEEFLWAKGYDDSFIAEMLAHMRSLTPFNEVEMSVCSELFLDYCILGGMPAVFASISADMKAIAVELYMNASMPGSVLLLGT